MKKVIQGRISSPFGNRYDPINIAYKMHQGVDVAAPVGTPIYSPTKGRVVATYEHPQGGMTMIVRSECGRLRFGFCHLSSYQRQAGQSVMRGELLALSGNSGRSTGPHLHYSVKRAGEWVGDLYTGGEFVDSSKYIDIQ